MMRVARWRRRLLMVAQASVVLAAVITFFAAQRPGPFRFGLFFVIAQPAILIGVVLYVSIAISEFLGSHGVLSRVHFARGETIFHQGDPGDSMYAVIDGEVEVVREEAAGKSTQLARLGPGQYFGEMALVSAAPRMATVRALTPVEVAVMGRMEFTALYAYLPDFHQSIDDLMRKRKPQ